jgi:hypothetical protein
LYSSFVTSNSKQQLQQCVIASLCMSDKPECRWAMPAGSCTVSGTVFSLMAVADFEDGEFQAL